MEKNISNDIGVVDTTETIRTILRHKGFISLVAFIFLIGSAIYAYYATRIYQSNTSIEILKENSNGDTDIILKALG